MSTIQDILRRPQRITENLSSRQIFLVLDDLIFRALEPLADTSLTLLEAFAEILAWSLLMRRKQNAESRAACFMLFFCDDKAAQVRAVLRAGVDRGHLFAYAHHITQEGKILIDAHNDAVKHRDGRIPQNALENLSRQLSRIGRDPLIIPALTACKYWMDLAVDFRGRITEKYLRLMYKNAVHSERTAVAQLEVPDLFSSAFLTASRAIEVFNSENGVLTSYLQLWLRGSSYDVSVQSIGRSHTVPSKNSADIAWSAPIESATSTVDAVATAFANEPESILLRKIDAVASDPDIRAALMVSGIAPPFPKQKIAAGKKNVHARLSTRSKIAPKHKPLTTSKERKSR